MDKLKIYLPAILLAFAGFILTYQFVGPEPSSNLRFSAGQKDGAYYAYAKRYQSLLKNSGINVEILESSGSLENIERLQQDSADIAFVQSGTTPQQNQADLASLGSMYHEPLWIFVRPDLNIHYISDLKGKKIAIGLKGSGTQLLARQLLSDNGVNESNSRLISISSANASKAILQKALSFDAIFIVSSAQNTSIKTLQSSSKLKLLNMPRAEAYTRIHPYLSPLSMPQGVLNLAENIPTENIQLLATTATLMIHQNLHPALQGLIMQTAQQIHREHQLISSTSSFPSPLYSDVALSPSAKRFYKSGPPFLQRFLPFRAATLVDRLKVMLLPLLALLLPLIKIMPPLYRWRIRSRIYRWYEKLSQIDSALNDGFSETLLSDLDKIEAEIRKVHVPLSYAVELYDLRLHLALVREQLEKASLNS
ncbi:MAG: TAXI family TRAP transporter solute-binding subunit [Mariprofundaceae bacterium]